MAVGKGSQLIINVAALIILEVAALCFLAFSDSVQSTWIGQVSTSINGGLSSARSNVSGYFRLRSKNDSLEAANARLFNLLRESREQYAEEKSGEWTKLRTRFQVRDASIVSLTTGSQHNYVIIDRGSVDGVMPDDGLITPKGVVGIIHSTTRRYALGYTFENQKMVLSTKVGHNGPVGSMSWNGATGHRATMTDIPIHITVEMGDTVYTSGYSTIFPADIPLGTVIAKSTDKGNSAELTVNLFEDYKLLHQVLVVRNLDADEIKSLSK